MRDERGGELHRPLDAAAEQVHHRLAAIEGHVNDLGVRRAEERGSGEMGVAAGARIADADLAGIGLGVIEKLRSVFHGASARTAIAGISTLTRATGSKARVVELQDAGMVVRGDRVRVPDHPNSRRGAAAPHGYSPWRRRRRCG